MIYISYIALLLFFTLQVQAQDAQYSQYYNAPLYLNPGFAGTSKFFRGGLNYRLQWPGTGEPYKSFSAWGDCPLGETYSALGLLIKRDVQGIAKLSSTDIGVLYAYKTKLNKRWVLKPGLQSSFVIRNIDFSRSLFSDQLNNSGATGNPTADPVVNYGTSFSYIDFSAGTLLHDKHIWAGLSMHHLNRPNQALSNDIKSPLPVKWSVHTGYKIVMRSTPLRQHTAKSYLTLTPTFNYKVQGRFDQLDMGLYAIYDPLMLGFWYRGLPVKNYRVGIPNHESLIILLGIRHGNLSIGYSYDLNISQLTGNSKGAHEVSLIYYFNDFKKIFEEEDDIPCPDLDIQYKKIGNR
ncbi:MAG: type IX secretion system membrane protein PorP/SprF [Cytophagaceae bacterium]|nr:type IX secretion system membrane protein PorP/SprF [Cytophagaceae bacterium]MDW8455649.1 type IX secretion system membrane protein PorP/SprF [Cytophagaceae bacterium]